MKKEELSKKRFIKLSIFIIKYVSLGKSFLLDVNC